jgi:uncharacterized protein (TIGR03546 family)
MLGQILKIFKALNSNASPWQLSLGVCLGAILGLTPFLSLHNVVVIFIALILNVNIGITIVSGMLFAGVAYLLDPMFHQLGYTVLKAEGLQGFWTQFFSCPVFILGNLNNTIVMGSLIVSLLLAIPLFFIFNVLVEKYRVSFSKFLEKFPFLKALKVVKIYQTLTGTK